MADRPLSVRMRLPAQSVNKSGLQWSAKPSEFVVGAARTGRNIRLGSTSPTTVREMADARQALLDRTKPQILGMQMASLRIRGHLHRVPAARRAERASTRTSSATRIGELDGNFIVVALC